MLEPSETTPNRHSLIAVEPHFEKKKVSVIGNRNPSNMRKPPVSPIK